MLGDRLRQGIGWGMRIVALCSALLLFTGIGSLALVSNAYAAPMPGPSRHFMQTATATASAVDSAAATAAAMDATAATATAVVATATASVVNATASAATATASITPTKTATPTPMPTATATPKPHKHKAKPTPVPTKVVQAVPPPVNPGQTTTTAPVNPTPTPSPTPKPTATATVGGADTAMSAPLNATDVQQQAGKTSQSDNRMKILSLGGTSALTVLGAGSLIAIGMRRKKLKQFMAQTMSASTVQQDVAYTSVDQYQPMSNPHPALVDQYQYISSPLPAVDPQVAFPVTPVAPTLSANSSGDLYATTPFMPSDSNPRLPEPITPGPLSNQVPQNDPSLNLEALMQQAQMGIFAMPSSSDQSDPLETMQNETL